MATLFEIMSVRRTSGEKSDKAAGYKPALLVQGNRTAVRASLGAPFSTGNSPVEKSELNVRNQVPNYLAVSKALRRDSVFYR